ncbi:Cell wall integrity and stress response component 1 [Fasciola hepatica]|uniref:Cell wall integrity and stress response component 1 n=1 Tax=Fasciola hepatica TaxID=6192 RepID=A0A4E0RFY7_FASHE|nr:Cell wall integrity and stress response component 1 [Fasciola hepatica]
MVYIWSPLIEIAFEVIQFANEQPLFTMSNDGTATLLVIGAGLGRTGTKSLKDALELLYQKPCYHMTELVHKHPDHVELWLRLFEQLKQDPESELSGQVLKKIFQGYSLTTDYPACSIYKQLMRIYPEAKIVLTVRDPSRWIESVRETIWPRESRLKKYVFDQVIKIVLPAKFSQMATNAVQYSMGPNVDLNNDEQMIQGFIRWNQEVKQVVPNDRLLIFDVKDGWKPLCTFLNKPIPDHPFPHVNDRAQVKSRFRQYYVKTLLQITPPMLVIAVAVILSICWLKRT